MQVDSDRRAYIIKHGSRERGRCCNCIAEGLTKVDQLKSNVDQRAVRNRFVTLEPSGLHIRLWRSFLKK